MIYVLSYTEIIPLFNYYFGIFVHYRQQLYGRNAISVEVKSYFYLLVTEVLNPFYIFQIASIVLWSFDNYILYATCIFLVSCLSVAVSLYETRKVSNLWLVLIVFLFFLYCILGFFSHCVCRGFLSHDDVIYISIGWWWESNAHSSKTKILNFHLFLS